MNVLSYLVGGVAVAMALSGCVPAHRDVCDDVPVDEVHWSTCQEREGDGARLGPGSNPVADRPADPKPSAPAEPPKAEPPGDDKPAPGPGNGGKSKDHSRDDNGGSSDGNSSDENGGKS